jgi:hypothetical protein
LHSAGSGVADELGVERRGGLTRAAVGGGIVALMSMLAIVVMGVRRSDPPTFAPTPLEVRPAAGRLVGPDTVTIDATAPDRWRYFSFEQGTLVERPSPIDWDIAFRRFQIIVNGGQGFAGDGGALDLGEVPFDSVHAVPVDGYVTTIARTDSVNAALKEWYRYSYLSHLLSPRGHAYAVRTADGRYAKLEFLGYYCPGATPGCVTFRYVYQGAGGVDLRSPHAPDP